MSEPIKWTNEPITFKATVSQIRTLADGGLRIVLDLPETAIQSATQLMSARQAGAFLECACIAILPTKTYDEPIRKPRNPLYQPKA